MPADSHVRENGGDTSAPALLHPHLTLLFVTQVVLTALALLFMPQAMSILAPGFTDEPEQRRLANELTRITFPYLLLITLVTLYGGMLNVVNRFASAAAASIFLNIAMMATLAVAMWFPTSSHASAWSGLTPGFLQYLLLGTERVLGEDWWSAAARRRKHPHQAARIGQA